MGGGGRCYGSGAICEVCCIQLFIIHCTLSIAKGGCEDREKFPLVNYLNLGCIRVQIFGTIIDTVIRTVFYEVNLKAIVSLWILLTFLRQE